MSEQRFYRLHILKPEGRFKSIQNPTIHFKFSLEESLIFDFRAITSACINFTTNIAQFLHNRGHIAQAP